MVYNVLYFIMIRYIENMLYKHYKHKEDKDMTKLQVAKVAAEVIESKLGFKVSRNDLILLECSTENKAVTYVLFYRTGFDDIIYKANLNKYGKWELEIIHEVSAISSEFIRF